MGGCQSFSSPGCKKKRIPFFVRTATIQVINPICIERRCAALDAMHFIALVEQKLGTGQAAFGILPLTALVHPCTADAQVR